MPMLGVRRGTHIRLRALVLALGALAPGAARANTEFNLVPIAGGDSDVGVGFGQVSDVAGFAPGYEPFLWRLETNAFITFALREGDKLVIPFQDYFLLLSVPQAGLSGRLRLDMRVAYTKETTLKFYGFGNATPFPEGVPLRQTEYGRVHPTVSIEARMRMSPGWYAQLGSVYTQNWMTVAPNSLLGMAQSSGTPDEQARIGNFAPHGVELIELGLQFDSRDNEIVPRRGQFHALQARLSPAVGSWLPYPYQQLDATFRFWVTPVPRWLTASLRVVGDLLLGDPPFYELARFDETPAIGGGKAVRGVPAERYYGKVKVFENLELRSEILPFTLRKKDFVLALAGFLDSGRVWTELGQHHPEDGTGLGLKYGVGGGLRLQQGQTFVVRFDVAWSPDARPIGAYFAAGEIF
jgi:outer membrane protein assembly factor BamA